MAARGPGIELRPRDPDRWAVTKMARPQHDQRSPEDFEAALWRATDASLRADPSRWPWQRTTDTLDHRKHPLKGRHRYEDLAG